MYYGITSGRVLDGELLNTKILGVNLFAFAYRLFHEDFASIDGIFLLTVPSIEEKSSWNSRQTVGKRKQINF